MSKVSSATSDIEALVSAPALVCVCVWYYQHSPTCCVQPSTNPTCQKVSSPEPSFLTPDWLDRGSKSLVRYDFRFHDLTLQNNLRVLRQKLQYHTHTHTRAGAETRASISEVAEPTASISSSIFSDTRQRDLVAQDIEIKHWDLVARHTPLKASLNPQPSTSKPVQVCILFVEVRCENLGLELAPGDRLQQVVCWRMRRSLQIDTHIY
jgi:hypothetical protein